MAEIHQYSITSADSQTTTFSGIVGDNDSFHFQLDKTQAILFEVEQLNTELKLFSEIPVGGDNARQQGISV